jgi:ketosteroid isomerase-like protein
VPDEKGVLDADRDFFAALIAGDAATLAGMLVDDFVIVDVMSGNEAGKDLFSGAVEADQLSFEEIRRDGEPTVRRYGTTAIVVGATEMRGAFGGAPFAAHSRYTHVFVESDDRWMLASAQGTPIAARPGGS